MASEETHSLPAEPTTPAPVPAPVPARRAATRMYASARNDRLTSGWNYGTSTADAELHLSLTVLRNRGRALTRDAAYARRAKKVVVNNVIGAGIGMQADVRTTRDELHEPVNDAIEREWGYWCCADQCHTGGKLCFSDMERLMMSEVFDAGEVLVREWMEPFGRSRVPYGLEVIEPERLADELTKPSIKVPQGRLYRMGVEVDRFHRPMGYYIRELHPGDVAFRHFSGTSDRLERVPADVIYHLYPIDRWPQTRGVPWMHAVARRLNDMDGYSEAEIVAARGAASYMGIITTDNPDPLSDPIGEQQPDGSFEFELSPGQMPRLRPGEDLKPFIPNRPNSQIDPFMRLMLREVAAGIDVSYESLSRDYAQSNYSSSRLALLDDRDVWKTLQLWFIRSFRERVHRRWLQQAIFAGVLPEIPLEAYAKDPRRYEAVKFKPRGWSWIDPEKEVASRKEAIKAGLDTLTNVIAETGSGRDVEDIFKERDRELKLAEAYGLDFDTDPEAYAPEEPAPAPAAPAAPPEQDEDEEEEARMRRILSIVVAAVRASERPSPAQHITVTAPPNTVINESPVFHNHMPEQPPAVVTVNAGDVNINERAMVVEAANISVPVTVPERQAVVHMGDTNVAIPERSTTVNVEASRAPEVSVPVTVDVRQPDILVPVNVEAPTVNVQAAEAPKVDVAVAAPVVNLEAPQVHIDAPIRVEAPTVNVEPARVDVHMPDAPDMEETTDIQRREGDLEVTRIVKKRRKIKRGGNN